MHYTFFNFIFSEVIAMEDISRIHQPNGIKVFIQRDYTDGTPVKFQTKFPVELEGKVKNV